MSREPSTSTSRDLRALLESGTAAGLTDAQLLRKYVDRRAEAEAAFEALVDRHGPMVWGVCRRALGPSHEAEDAFQATFLVLARRADAVRVDGSLGRWLHGVASKVAVKARSLRHRRQVRELGGQAAEPTVPPPDFEQAELLSALDEELARLPEKYRSPLVLCHLEGLTYAESAERLGCPPGAIKGRLTRGRELLRARLARRGLGLPDSALEESIADEPRPIVPPLLAGSIVRTASASAKAAGASTTTLILAKGVLRTMFLTRLSKLLILLAPASALVALRVETTSPSATPEPKGPPPLVALDEPPPGRGTIIVPLPARDDLQALLRQAAGEAIAIVSKEPQPSSWALTTIAKAQASAGDPSGARQTFAAASREAGGDLGGAPSPWNLWRVGHFQAEAGLHEDARATLRRALESTPGVSVNFDKDHETVRTLAEIVKDQAGLGDRDEASRTADRLRAFTDQILAGSKNVNTESIITPEIAAALAAVGDFKGAFRRAGPAFMTDQIVGGAALAAATYLDRDQARRFVAEAVDRMTRIEWADQKYHGLSDLAEAQARVGDFDGAKRSALTIGEGPNRASYDMTDGQPYAMLRIAEVQRKAGQVVAARETLREAYRVIVDHPKMRGPDGRFFQVAASQVVANDFDGAFRSSESMSQARRAETLANIARALAIAGRGEEARKTIDRALANARSNEENPPKPDPDLRTSDQAKPFAPNAAAMMLLSEIQAMAGDTKGALKTIETIDNEDSQRFTLKRVVSARATAGDVKGAMDMATRDANNIRERRSALEAFGQGIETRLMLERR